MAQNTTTTIMNDDSNVFMQCYQQDPTANTTQLLQCVADTLQQTASDHADSIHSFLLVLAGAMIFFMQAGFAMLCAGSVRLKNVQNTMLKNLLDACGAAIAFFLLGTCHTRHIMDGTQLLLLHDQS